MVQLTRQRACEERLSNVRVEQRDFMVQGTGLAAATVDYVMLFNILHCEDPVALLGEARRILRAGGLLGIMHWNYDSSTPRGPSMHIRPSPDQCLDWAVAAGFHLHIDRIIHLPPYHYDWVVAK